MDKEPYKKFHPELLLTEASEEQLAQELERRRKAAAEVARLARIVKGKETLQILKQCPNWDTGATEAKRKVSTYDTGGELVSLSRAIADDEERSRK